MHVNLSREEVSIGVSERTQPCPKTTALLPPALAGTAYLEVLNKLLWPDLDQQLELPQLPLQQLLVRQLKSDFAGGRNADRHVKLLQFSACDSAGGEQRFTSWGEGLLVVAKVYEAC